MALSNNLRSFYNFNMAQQQRAQQGANSQVSASASGAKGTSPGAGQMQQNRNQMRDSRRQTQTRRQGQQTPQNSGTQAMNRQMPQNAGAQAMRRQMPPQTANAMPTQQMQNRNTGTHYAQTQQPQMPAQQPFKNQQAPAQYPQTPAFNQQPTAQNQSAAEQVTQYMKGESSGIAINEENISQLIKTFNQTDGKQNMGQPDSHRDTKIPVEDAGKIAGKPQRETEIERLAQHIQNETNGAAFYSHLTNVAPTVTVRQNFEEISERCRQRADAYGKIYHERSGKQFEAKNVVINNQVSCKDGILLALNEERKSIADLFIFYEALDDVQIEKSINCQIFRKLIDLHVLMDMKLSG